MFKAALAGLVVLAAVLAPGLLFYAAQDTDSQVKIGDPQAGEQVSGLVQIAGTALDPAFQHYELAYSLDPAVTEQSWFPIQPPVAQQVRDGILGVWDTTPLADGRYLLRLRLMRTDGSFMEDIVRVQVVNATPTPLPTLPPPPSPTPLPGTPMPGPSPTPLIWQPPTRTPRPTATPGGPTPTLPPLDPDQSPLNPDRLQRAAWRGALFTLGAFCLLGLYVLFQARLRDELRVLFWDLRQRLKRD